MALHSMPLDGKRMRADTEEHAIPGVAKTALAGQIVRTVSQRRLGGTQGGFR
jgi:hypothetical protein